MFKGCRGFKRGICAPIYSCKY